MATLLTLNVSNPPKARAEALLHWLWPRDEDVWVLTEVGTGAGSSLLVSVCRAAGFDVHVTDRSDLGVLTVARAGSLAEAPVESPAVLPGRVDSLVWQPDSHTKTSGVELRLLAAYGAASDPVRYSSKAQRERKRQWLAAYDAVLGEWVGRGPRGVVIGDLNLVDPVHDDELKFVLPEETATYAGLSERHGLVDAFRVQHDDAQVSWVDHTGVGCRYDHAFVTMDLTVTACDLVHEPRLDDLTDHSALTLTVAA